jgi:16S rRNA processing protein RimM
LTEQFITGLIGPPFGLKGFVKIRPLSGEIEHLLRLQTVTVRQGEKERVFTIEESLAQPPALLMKFAGVDSPEAAKTLGGAELLVNRERASPLGPGEYYVEDLRGLAVVAEGTADIPAGEILGRVTGIVEGGGGELAEITLAGGGVKLVPFRKEFFIEICPEKGRLILRNLWILE